MAKNKTKGTKKLLPYSGILFGAVILTILLYVTGPLQFLEQRIVDELYTNRGALDISESPIVIVAISQTADEEIPFKYPWPTDIHARLVRNLNRAGAKVIGFDVIFDQPDIYDPANDLVFAQAIREAGNVFLAADIKAETFGNSESRSLVLPTEVLNEANPNPPALVETVNEIDGKVRRYLIRRPYRNENYYLLAWEILRYVEGLEGEPFIENNDEFGIGQYLVDKSTANSFLINYQAPAYSFPIISYEEVIDDSTFTTVFESEAFDINKFDNEFDGLLQQGVFKDKIVLIGATMPTLQDFHLTPFVGADISSQMPGVEIHANALQSILSDNYLRSISGWFTLFLTALLSFIVIAVNYRWNYAYGIGLSVIIIAAYIFIGYQQFIGNNLLIVFTAPILSVLITQIGSGGYEYFITRREKFRIQNMFSSYVSPKLVDQMIESGEDPELGGDEHEITAFFSDIASFSVFSEKLEAKRLVFLINEYLNEMTNILTDEGGTLDKYIGDAIVGFFGAPALVQNHEYHACLAAMLMQKKQAELREKWAIEKWPDVVRNMRTRIGLNTGMMVTGNMGSNKRFNYTMMGDNVNLAARCESGAKTYGVYTMVTESTQRATEKVSDRILFRYLDNIVVMGREQPVKVFEAVALKEDRTQQIDDLIGLFKEGINAYLDKNWDVAISKFEITAHLELFQPGQPGIKTNPSEMYIDRCRTMKDLPDIEAWDGVFRMKTK